MADRGLTNEQAARLAAMIDGMGTTPDDQRRWARMSADLSLRVLDWVRDVSEHPTFLVADWSVAELAAVLPIVGMSVGLAPPGSDVRLIRQATVAVVRQELETRLAARELEDQG